MKITDIKGLGVEQLATPQPDKVGAAQGEGSTASSPGEVDVIHISPESRLMQKAAEVVAATPEVRPEKVAPLQEAVHQGTYEVDAAKVANSLIASMILEQ
jgi:flagellar biosynthesis anti-sigma factor FlgM